MDAGFPWRPLVLEKRPGGGASLFSAAGLRIRASQAFLTAIRWGLLPLVSLTQRSVECDLRAVRERTVWPSS